VSFKNQGTEDVFNGLASRAASKTISAELQKLARRKLRMVDAAVRLDDLRFPPGNAMEALRADREGQYSIRINSQYRICLTWTPMGPADVEVVDYH
ncbi:MAG TPA: type II toxin-antitoxin system RelE/ParE family toxin, partial [Longimicrobium sp.]